MLNNSRRGVQVKGNRQTDATSDTSLLLDSLRNEVSILSRKLGSKTEALAIMAKELDQCRLDRDQFRAMLEQLRGSHKAGGSSWSLVASDAGLRHQLALSRQQCADLQRTVTDLTLKMEEVCGDMMVLRRDAVRQRCPTRTDSTDSPVENQGDMVTKMEQLQDQCDQLRRDLELMLDEKEELVTQRDAYKGKTHRLNHQLQVALRAPADSTLDVDSLVTENRYVREQLSTSQDELERLQRVCAKYKSLLEARKKKGILRMGTADSSALIVTKRQVAEMLRSGSDVQLLDTPATLSDLRSLCAALLEQLQDKCTALTHQRKANKLLAEQCSVLRQQADRHGLSVQPSADLMAGYSVTHIDRESEQLLQTPEEAVSDGGGAAADPQHDASPPRSPHRAGAGPLTNGSTEHGPPGRAAPGRPRQQQQQQSPPRQQPQEYQQPPSPRRQQSQQYQQQQQQQQQSPARQQQKAAADGASLADVLSSPVSLRLPAERPEEEEEFEEEILSIQELDRYMRCLRRPGDVRPVQVISDQDGGQVTSPSRGGTQVTSPSRGGTQASPSRGAARCQSDSQPGSPARPAPDGGAAPGAAPSGPCLPAAAVSGAQPAVQVVNSPSRTLPPPLSRCDSSEQLPAELDRLYRLALDQLRAGDQAT